MTETNPLQQYVTPLRRWWMVVVATVGLGLLVAWLTLPERPEVPAGQQAEGGDPEVAYEATHILMQGRPSSATSNLDLVALLAQQGEIQNRVRAELADRVPPEAVDGVIFRPDSDLGTLSVSAVQPTEDLARLLAQTYAEAVADHFDARADAVVEEQLAAATDRLAAIDERVQELEAVLAAHAEGTLDWRLADSEMNVLVDQYAELQAELRRLHTTETGAGSTLETLQEAVPVATLAGPNMLFEVPESSRARFGLAALIAALLGVALAIGIDRVDSRLRDREDTEAAFGLPVVSEIPRLSRRVMAQNPIPVQTEPGSETAEAFRALRVAVQVATRWRLQQPSPTAIERMTGGAKPVNGKAGPPRTLLVTSSVTGEGKSTVTANLAASIAESGARVLVVDCDFRRPMLQELLVQERPLRARRSNLCDLVEPSLETLEPLVTPTKISGVSLVAAGPAGNAPPWFLPEAWVLVAMATELADVVIFDTGPLLATSEAAALIPHIDAVLMVARAGLTSFDQARLAMEQLTRLQAMVAGVVLVGEGATRSYGYYEPLRRAAAAGEAVGS